MNENKRTSLPFVAILVVLLALAGYVGFGFGDKQSDVIKGSFDDRNVVTLMGSSGNLTSVPNEASYSNSTTTDEGGSVAEGGATIQQLVNTGGIRKVNLNLSMIGGTATSTLYLQVMGSPDGTNYYQRSTTTDPYSKIATTSVAITQKAYQIVPNTATTTISMPIEIDGHRFTRFILWGDNLSTDPDDSIQAWITATLIRDKEN